MKLYFLMVLVCSGSLMQSCKKDVTKTDPIGVDINNSYKNYNNGINVRRHIQDGLWLDTTLLTGTIYVFSFSGSHGEPGLSNEISLSIFSRTPIVAGTYTNKARGFPIVNVSLSSFFLFGMVPFGGTDYNTDNSATVTINSINSSSVTGNFNGDIYGTDYNGNPKNTSLRNGHFKLNF